MKSVIRWQGLAAFVVLVGLLAGFFLLFADSLLKSVIEKQGSNLAGAKVELADVSLRLQPAGIELHGLQVADAGQPMRNVVTIEHIALLVDPWKALMGQLIIDQADVTGMRFDTPRSTSGALEKKPAPVREEPAEPSFASQQFAALAGNLPDSKTLLQREPLLLDQRSDELQQSYDNKKDRWHELQQQLPDQQRLDEYQQRLDTILQGKISSLEDFRAREAALKQLKQDIRNDRALLQSASDFVSNSERELAQQLGALKKAPGEDVERISGKYGLDDQGISNAAALLFGDKLAAYLQQALYWYRKLSPYLASDEKKAEPKKQRMQGRFVRFAEAEPLPDILLRELHASALLEAGPLAVDLRDVTHQQDILGRPSRLQLSSAALRNIGHLELSAVFDYRGVDNHSRADFAVSDMRVENYRISGGSDLPLQLASAMTDIHGELRLARDSLSGQLLAQVQQAQFRGEGKNAVAKALLEALAGIQRFDIEADISGRPASPDIDLRSDIDKQLKKALDAQLAARKAAFRQQLEDELAARLDAQLSRIGMEPLAGGTDLDQRIGQLDEMLKSQLADYQQQQKQEAKDKAKDELKDKLKKLF